MQPPSQPGVCKDPGDPQPATVAAAASATSAAAKDAIDEEGISPVTQVAAPVSNVRALLALCVGALLLLGLGYWVFGYYWAQHRAQHDLESAQRSAAGQPATAASAGARPLQVTANAAGVPPTVGGVEPAVSLADAARDAASAHRVERVDEIRIPAIDLTGAQTVPFAPIGVLAEPGAAPRAAGARAGTVGATPADPLDAPVLLAPAAALPEAGRSGIEAALDDGMLQARSRLEETRARLEQVMKGVGQGTGPGTSASAAGSTPGAGVEGGIKTTSTARIGAARLAAPALTLPRGMRFGCALASRIVSEQTGPVSCVVSRNLYGSDGRVLLIERGSQLVGAYHAQVHVGQTRIAVLWERLRMPNGVVVDLASPATGALGEAGVDGFVDNHWPQRIGAALFLSFIDDAVKLEIAREQARGNASGTLLLQGSGSDTSTLAGKVLDSTLNIPPTIVKNAGELVGVDVAHDVDFSTVYELHAAPR